MEDCIFCKIINKQIPSFIVYENNDFIVILDRFPAAAGHCLIISKEHSEDLFSVSSEILSKALPLAKDIAARLKAALDFDGLNIIQNNQAAAGQSVFHFHIHLIPRRNGDNVPIRFAQNDVTLEELAEIREKIISSQAGDGH